MNSATTIKIPFCKPYIAGNELQYIADAIERKQLKGDGFYTQQCSNLLEQLLGGKRVLLTTSGTTALEMASLLLDLQVDDEVIMPSFTFVSTANAFVLRRAKPVFVDIRLDTFNIDEKKITAAITAKTKAICVVHYAGVPCDMDEIHKIADEHHLAVIEDAAQALGSVYKGKKIGETGDLVCFSFHETKNIIAGEGGALVINNPQYINRAEIIREKGTNRAQFIRGERKFYSWEDMGSSFLPSEFNAAFLYSQLLNFEKIQNMRMQVFNFYREQLFKIIPSNVRFQRYEEYIVPNGHIFGLQFPSESQRNDFIAFMGERGIQCSFHFVPLHSAPAGLKYGRVADALPNTCSIASGWVRLPLYPDLTKQELEYIVSSVQHFFLRPNE